MYSCSYEYRNDLLVRLELCLCIVGGAHVQNCWGAMCQVMSPGGPQLPLFPPHWIVNKYALVYFLYSTEIYMFSYHIRLNCLNSACAANFSALLNLLKGKV
jgi:hypothetical protein